MHTKRRFPPTSHYTLMVELMTPEKYSTNRESMSGELWHRSRSPEELCSEGPMWLLVILAKTADLAIRLQIQGAAWF
jgi:hypothetical protein